MILENHCAMRDLAFLCCLLRRHLADTNRQQSGFTGLWLGAALSRACCSRITGDCLLLPKLPALQKYRYRKGAPHIQLCQASLQAAYYHGQKAHNFHINLGRIFNRILDGMQSDGIISSFLFQELCPSTSSWLRGSANCLSVIFCVNGRHNGTRYGNLLAFSKPNRHPT